LPAVRFLAALVFWQHTELQLSLLLKFMERLVGQVTGGRPADLLG